MIQSFRLRTIDVWSVFKVAFILYAVLGLVAGVFYAFVFVVLGQLGNFLGDEDIPGLGVLTGFLGVVAIPVLAMLYGVFGSVVVAIGGALYNLAARWVGGIRMDFEVTEKAAPAPAEAPPAG